MNDYHITYWFSVFFFLTLCFLELPWSFVKCHNISVEKSVFMQKLARQPFYSNPDTCPFLMMCPCTIMRLFYLVIMMQLAEHHFLLLFSRHSVYFCLIFDFLNFISCLPISFGWLLYWQMSWLWGLFCLLLDMTVFLPFHS